MKIKIPRLVIGAPASGSGKTVVTCAVLQALKQEGVDCRAFKCGPDYIDPMFHRQILGIPGRNIDTFFLERSEAAACFGAAAAGADLAVIEGVMGFFDGVGGTGVQASAYDVSEAVSAPAVLVLDGRGASLSLAAMAKGFLEYRRPSPIMGVILNRVSPVLGERLEPYFQELGLRYLGCLPVCEAAAWDSRHLGLMQPEEIEDLKEKMERLAKEAKRTLRLEELLKLAGEASELEIPDPVRDSGVDRPLQIETGDRRVRVAVAMDPAFRFYYRENLELLEKQGAELVFFSPMSDPELPPGIGGLILGGGYPERYAKELSDNVSMRNAVRAAAENGLPVLAECGGFLYLQSFLEGMDGQTYPMAGVFDGTGFRTGRLTRFGYVELSAGAGGELLKPGETIRGHEFHYWDVGDPGGDWTAKKPGGSRCWPCMKTADGLAAGFPHLYYPSNPMLTKRWLEHCRIFAQRENLPGGGTS